MSLVIAKKENNKICIVSDTKLTSYPLEMNPQREQASPKDGVIKCTILNPHLCISVAGDMEGVNEILKSARSFSNALKELLDTLSKFSKLSEGRTAFIVGISYHPLYKIFQVKNGIVMDVNDSFIGSDDGFLKFQEYRDTLLNDHPQYDFQYNTEMAMKQVIESSAIPTVSGYVISVTNENGVFKYRNSIEMYITQIILPPGYSVISHGSAEEGAYTIHFFPSNKSFTALAIHIMQGNFGIVYSEYNGGLLYPEVISDTDEEEFSEIVEQRYGIIRSVSTPSQQASYYKRGKKAFAEKNFEKALELYDKGLAINDQLHKAVLTYNKGVVLFNLNRHSEAISAFNEAVKLDSAFQGQILGFMQAQKR